MWFEAPSGAQPTRDRTGAVRRELLVVSSALAAYFGARVVVEGDRAAAIRNAERLIELERWLGVDVERAVQRWVLAHDVVRWLLSAGYVWLHWPLLIASMVFLTLRAPEVQARLRNSIIVSAAIGVVLFAVVPMAPPRFMPGFVGTVSDDARRHFLPYPLSWTNQVAAFPSYHVGWTLLACLAIASVVRHRWLRVAAGAAAGIVAIAVVGTGNHYVVDSVSGALLALAAWWAVGSVSVRHGEHGDRARISIDPDDGAVGDSTGGVGRRDDAGATELTGHDDRMAHLPTDVDDDRLDRHEQWCP